MKKYFFLILIGSLAVHNPQVSASGRDISEREYNDREMLLLQSAGLARWKNPSKWDNVCGWQIDRTAVWCFLETHKESFHSVATMGDLAAMLERKGVSSSSQVISLLRKSSVQGLGVSAGDMASIADILVREGMDPSSPTVLGLLKEQACIVANTACDELHGHCMEAELICAATKKSRNRYVAAGCALTHPVCLTVVGLCVGSHSRICTPTASNAASGLGTPGPGAGSHAGISVSGMIGGTKSISASGGGKAIGSAGPA